MFNIVLGIYKTLEVFEREKRKRKREEKKKERVIRSYISLFLSLSA